MENQKYKVGQIFWTDLTVDNASLLKGFYKEVIGWEEHAVSMKDGEENYEDFAMMIDKDTPASGICNRRGLNANIPPQWIVYFQVEDVNASLEKALGQGGKMIHNMKKSDGTYQFIILEDPNGAVFGIGKME